jgi:hypothetical protein
LHMILEGGVAGHRMYESVISGLFLEIDHV